MEDVLKMAKSLKEKYEAMLEKFDDLLLDDLGNIEKTLKAIFNGYDEEMEQLKNKILMMKNGRQEQGTGSTEINS